jgi:hypothetical protein
MTISAQCPNCSAPLSETSVCALAPVCDYCGTVVVKTGGSLGITGAYGVNDPSLTKKRIEADLKVLEEHRSNCLGMLLASKEQLNWNVERYAVFPPRPVLVRTVRPKFWFSYIHGLNGKIGKTLLFIILLSTVLFFALISIFATITPATITPATTSHSDLSPTLKSILNFVAPLGLAIFVATMSSRR